MSGSRGVTALIPAYNAEATVVRAIESVMGQVDHILVWDDGSVDNTVKRVRAMGIPHLTCLQSGSNKGVGATRQRLLQACESDIAVWLDADDEFLEGRVARLRNYIDAGAQWVFDAAELVDAADGRFIRSLPIPDFLFQHRSGLLWEFARNYIPSLGWAMVSVSAARKIGYREELKQAEDYDHLLRAILAEGDIRFCTETGYRQYDLPGSVSRDIKRQTGFMQNVLSSLDGSSIGRLLEQSELCREDRSLIWAYYLARTEAWHKLLDYVDTQPDSHWELAFLQGVAHFCCGNFEAAARAFSASLEVRASACGYNNLGVSLLAGGDQSGKTYISRALEIMPHYSDAKNNNHVLNGAEGCKLLITRIPLREVPIRDRY